MDEKTIEKNEEISIDIQRILSALFKKSWVIVIVAVLCAAITLVGTIFMVEPKYNSSVMFYVNNSSVSVGDVSMSITSGDISASRNLVKSYIVILNTRQTLRDVIDYAGVNRTVGAVKGMISAESVDNTEIFRITVTSEDPQEAEKIASAIAYILPKRIDSVIDGTSAKIVDAAVVPTSPSSPSYTTNTIIGFLVGALAVCVLIVLRELFDIMIRTEEDVVQIAGEVKILAAVPNMGAPSKSDSYASYRKPYANRPETGKGTDLIGAFGI